MLLQASLKSIGPQNIGEALHKDQLHPTLEAMLP